MWEAVRLVEELDCENIKAVIDFYNMEHMGEGDLDLRKWMPYIAHAHISDDDGAPDMRSFFRLEIGKESAACTKTGIPVR